MVSPNSLQIDGATRIMGVIGDPVVQVLTPEAINPIFAAARSGIVCLPIHVPKHALADAWRGLRAMSNLIGFGVTLPHKQQALGLCDSVDELAQAVGAVNVVRRERDGSLRGYQFDGQGFLRGLLGEGHRVTDRTVLMVGAGGAAMAIAHALLDAGCGRLTIANRTLSRAEALAEALRRTTGRGDVSAGYPQAVAGQLVVNATSLGLSEGDPLPLEPDLLNETMIVAEVIAKPETTCLLQEAAARGARTLSGIHMIRGQVRLIAEHLMAA